ncbi:hypothetical protein [Listeria immobilis]|uniref:hypothetical protein n=2 Tax=Listeria TaxID=1637 RepID=UPI001623566A|nr:hypothetical protein [Listeria immobilis]MBC1516941.1 hypothetical protein [Listeria immobilis]
MEYYVYKINIQPNILEMYEKENDFVYLISEVIPNSFEAVLQVKRVNNCFQFIVDNATEYNFDEEFNQLEIDTKMLIKGYNQIIQYYNKSGEIFYSKAFLSLNEKCGTKRRHIEVLFPGIKKAYDLISDEQIEESFNLEHNNQVGTSITHIRKFYKIKLFMNSNEFLNVIKPLNLESIYNPSTEHLLVKTNQADLANNYVEALTRIVNENKSVTDQIGRVNINPIYESVQIESDFSEISFVIVYPNGNPPQNRDSILRDSCAKEEKRTLVGTDLKPLKREPIEEFIAEKGKKGYLKNINVKGKFWAKIKKINDLNADKR